MKVQLAILIALSNENFFTCSTLYNFLKEKLFEREWFTRGRERFDSNILELISEGKVNSIDGVLSLSQSGKEALCSEAVTQYILEYLAPLKATAEQVTAAKEQA